MSDLLINLGHLCNNNCIFCTNPAWGHSLIGFDRILEYRNAIKAATRINITGGEPTIYKHMIETLQFINRINPDATIFFMTNARMLSVTSYFRQLLKIKNMQYAIALQSHREDIHDMLTQVKGSFSQTMQGIQNLEDYGCRYEIRTLITKINHDDLQETINFIRQRFPRTEAIVLMAIILRGKAIVNLDKLYIKYKDINLDFDDYNKLRLYHFPLCLIPKDKWEYAYKSLASWKIVYPEVCNTCSVKDYCAGLIREYAKIIGVGELVPQTVKVEFSGQQTRPIGRIL